MGQLLKLGVIGCGEIATARHIPAYSARSRPRRRSPRRSAALHLMGYPEPSVVLGSTHLRIGNRDGIGLWGQWDWRSFAVEDMAVGQVRFVNGASLVVETSFAANIEAPETTQVSLMGDHGGADVFPLRIYQERHGTLVDTTPINRPAGPDPYALQASRFVDLCLTGEDRGGALVTPREGLAVQRVVDALYRSASSDEAISLSPAPREAGPQPGRRA